MNHSIKSWKYLCIVLPFLVTVLGCGGATVSGKVTFEDGTPLTVGMVCFEIGAEQMIGPIQSDGTYVMTPDDRKKKIPKGEYKVCITNAYVEVGEALQDPGSRPDFTGDRSASGGRRMTQCVIHNKFESTITSNLTCKVDGPTVYDITVTKP